MTRDAIEGTSGSNATDSTGDGAHPRRLYFDDLADDLGDDLSDDLSDDFDGEFAYSDATAPRSTPDELYDQEADTDAEAESPLAVPARLAARWSRARDGRSDLDPMADTGPIEVVHEPGTDFVAADRGTVEQMVEPVDESADDDTGEHAVVTGAGQLHFDDLADDSARNSADWSAVDDAAMGAVVGATAAGEALDRPGPLAPVVPPRPGKRRRDTRPVGAVLALLGVLVLVGVIASVMGRGQHSDHRAAAPTKHRTAASRPTASARPSTATSRPPSTASASRPTTAPKPTHAPTGPAASAPPVLTPAQLSAEPLTVLNNTTTTGLAARAAVTFSGKGWHVGPVGNYTGAVPVTTVYYDAGDATQRSAAQALARQFPDVAQVRPRFSGLPGSGLTVVLAPDWS